MNILAININYWPEQTGIAPFATGRCEYLAARGHGVTVCTAMPYYPEWRIADGYRKKGFVEESRNGVSVRRTWLYVPGKRITTPRRILHELSFAAGTFVAALSSGRPDIMVVTSPPLGLGIVAAALSRIWAVPYIFHVPDLQPDAAVDLGMMKRGRFLDLLYRIESLAYRGAAMVSTITETMQARIVSKGVPADKTVVLSDWVEPALFDLPQVQPAEDKRILVSHFGNMGIKQGLQVVLETAEATAADEQIEYMLVGDGADRRRLEACASTKELRNLKFLPLQAQAEFMNLLARSDICLVTQQASVADIVFPSKVITLLAAGRPVIASVSDRSEVARTISEANAGLVVPPEAPEQLKKAIIDLKNDPARRKRMGEAGRDYAMARWERSEVLRNFEASVCEAATLRNPGLLTIREQ